MTLNLPKPIDTYFTADRGEGKNDIAQCFTENATVKDEGQTYVGLAAIKRWKEDSANKYTYTSEPFSFEAKDGLDIVTSHLTGNFPGSPVDLRYIFSLEGDKIASLEITV